MCRGLVSSPEAAGRGRKAFFGSQGDVVCSLGRALALVSVQCVTKEQPFWEGELRQGDFVFVL